MGRSGFLGTAVIALAAAMAVTLTPADALACRAPAGNFVWHDLNRNGLQDAGEPGIPNVRLTISPMTDYPWQTEAVTNSDGYYQFDGLACNTDYTIQVDASTLPPGFAVTMLGVGPDRGLDSNDPNGVSVNIPWVPDPVILPVPDFTIDFGYVTPCTGAIGDLVWVDGNMNGIQDAGEPGIAGASVSLNGSTIASGAAGEYLFSGLCPATYNICVQVPSGYQSSPANQGPNDALDSDGLSDGLGNSCASVALGLNELNRRVDFGFIPTPPQPGTGTPGYWKNHPEAWPVATITIGGVTYSRESAIALLEEDPKDKTTTLFRALVAAKLNVMIGNDDSCIASTIDQADGWMASWGPVGSRVRASSVAWKLGEPLYRLLDNYNNGMLCAPARD